MMKRKVLFTVVYICSPPVIKWPPPGAVSLISKNNRKIYSGDVLTSKMDRRDFLKLLELGVGTALVGSVTVSSEYMDVSGFSKLEMGRTKNSIATVVADLVGQKLYGNSQIDVEIQKQGWPDARVTGNTTPISVDTYVDLAVTSSHFRAQQNGAGMLEGEVGKISKK